MGHHFCADDIYLYMTLTKLLWTAIRVLDLCLIVVVNWTRKNSFGLLNEFEYHSSWPPSGLPFGVRTGEHWSEAFWPYHESRSQCVVLGGLLFLRLWPMESCKVLYCPPYFLTSMYLGLGATHRWITTTIIWFYSTLPAYRLQVGYKIHQDKNTYIIKNKFKNQ